MNSRPAQPGQTSPSNRRWIWWSYALTPALVAVVTVIRVRLGQQHGPLLLLMFLPVLIAALRGGLGPGLLATALSTITSWVFVLGPTYSHPGDLVDVSILILEGVTTSILSEWGHRARTRAEMAKLELIQTQERFKTAFRLSPLGKILVRISDDRIVETNEAYTKILGCADSEIIGHTLAEHDPLVDPDALQEVRRLLAKGSAVRDIEVQFRRKSGLIGSGILYAESLDGAPEPHVLIVLNDITTRQRAEDELRLANLDLQQFAFVAAHDLQEPARNVSTALGFLKWNYRSALDDEASQLVQESIDAAKRMHRMIRDLLAFSKTGNPTAATAPDELRTDCNDTLRQVLENLKRHAAQSGAEIAASELPVLSIQPTHLLQLLQNLVGNAIKYRAEGVPPRIHIDARLEASTWTFSVSDNGIGFDAQFAHQIFGVFKRLHQTADYPGNGIGLAICERIVRYYGGRIWANSEPGKGSTFYFSLPSATISAPAVRRANNGA